jgi:glycosyltransferase involved in cell wall biosynthesis
VPSHAPQLSLVTVTYNSAGTLLDTIASVRAQQYPGLQYIVIDGGSTDGTLEIIRQNSDVITDWVSEADRGVYDAMNKGIAMASGEVIGLVNSDDFLEPGALQAVAEAYRQAPTADVFHGNVRNIHEPQGHRYVFRPSSDLRRAAVKGMPVAHPATFVSKRAYDAHGTFDLRYRIAADYDLILRLLEAGVQFVHVDRVLSNMRQGGLSGQQHWRTSHEVYCIKRAHGFNRAIALWYLAELAAKGFFVHSLGKLPFFYAFYKQRKAPCAQ